MEELEIIHETVYDYYDIPYEFIDKKYRKKELVRARQICHYFAKKITFYSYSEIGANLGKRDHATVLHSCKTIDNLMFRNEKFTNEISELRNLIGLKLSDGSKVKFLVYLIGFPLSAKINMGLLKKVRKMYPDANFRVDILVDGKIEETTTIDVILN